MNVMIIYGVIIVLIISMIYYKNIQISLIVNGIILLLLVWMIKQNNLEFMTTGVSDDAIQIISDMYNSNNANATNLIVLNDLTTNNAMVNTISGNNVTLQSLNTQNITVPNLTSTTITTNNLSANTANISGDTTIGGTISVAGNGKISDLVIGDTLTNQNIIMANDNVQGNTYNSGIIIDGLYGPRAYYSKPQLLVGLMALPQGRNINTGAPMYIRGVHELKPYVPS